MSLLKSIATVGGHTSVSRIVGFIRDILIARFLGASMMADAFFVALRFPNLFRSLFAEGTLNVAFVPLFSGKIHAEGQQKALVFARSVFSFLFYILLAFTIVMEILMPFLMFILAPGFDQIEGKLALTTMLSRITFPYLLCISLVSLLAGVLNSTGRFWAAAFAPTILNLAMIATLLFLTPFLPGDYAPAYALSYGVFLAGVIQLVFIWYHIKKAGLTFGLIGPVKAIFHLSKDVKILLKKMAPGVLGSGVYQINLFLSTLFVSFVGEGAVSWLNYAQHMFQLPIGVIGVAIGTALLPILSKHVKAGELREANTQLNRGLELSLTLSAASMMGLVLLAYPIIGILFERGAFTSADTTHTSRALIVMALGFPAYMMTKALSPFFYARGDTTTPVRIGIVGVVLNSILSLVLMQFWGYVGIALATSITVWINALQYAVRLSKQGEFSLDTLFKYRLPRILFSVFIMSALLFFMEYAMNVLIPNWQHEGRFSSIFMLGGLVGFGVMVFGMSLIVLKAISLADLKRYVKRR